MEATEAGAAASTAPTQLDQMSLDIQDADAAHTAQSPNNTDSGAAPAPKAQAGAMPDHVAEASITIVGPRQPAAFPGSDELQGPPVAEADTPTPRK